MTSADLMRFERQRRYATLVALAVEGTATITDEVIGLHDRIVGKLFNAAKHKHQEQFRADGRAINEKLRLYGKVGQALLAAKQNGSDPFAAIETIVSWEDFAGSITEAQKLVQPEDFDFLHRIGEGYATLRRYAPELLDVLGLHAAPAAKPVLEAIELLREMNAGGIRELPDDAPLDFIRERWAKLIFTDAGIDRRYYELRLVPSSALLHGLVKGWAHRPLETSSKSNTRAIEPDLGHYHLLKRAFQTGQSLPSIAGSGNIARPSPLTQQYRPIRRLLFHGNLAGSP